MPTDFWWIVLAVIIAMVIIVIADAIIGFTISELQG